MARMPRLQLALIAAVITVPVFAAPPETESTAQTTDAYLSEKVCETITYTGSRLAKRRYCLPRREWQQRRLEDRQAVEKVQLSPCVLTHNSGTGKPAC